MNKIKNGFLAAAIVLLMLGVFGCANDPDDGTGLDSGTDSGTDTDDGTGLDSGTDTDDGTGLDSGTDTDDLKNPGMKNPLTGVWKTGNEYWQFKTDGTGGKAASPTGAFPNNFSFFVYLESQFYASSSNKQQSLVILDNSGNVTRYLLDVTVPNCATLTTPSGEGDPITLERINGTPCALGLKNSLIGEYTSTWYAANGTQSNGTWSIAYYTDGTAKFYHLTAGHQFQNSYLIRGDKLVIYGNMRFGGLNATITPIIATISTQEDGTLKIAETSGIYYVYTKVEAATWKEE